MSLNRNDIEILKEVFHPEFDRLHERIDILDEKIDEKIDGKIDGLKQYVDTRFEQIDRSISSIARSIVDELYEMYTPREVFDPLEKRVTTVENKLL